MAYTMNFRRYIPDHAITTVPVLALMFVVPYYLVREDPIDTGIELVAVGVFLFAAGIFGGLPLLGG